MNTDKTNKSRFDAEAEHWDDDARRVHSAQKVARALREALTPDGTEKALEVGAGTGLVTLLLAPVLGHVTAIDSSPGMLGVLRQKLKLKGMGNVDVIEGLVPDAIPEAAYDLAYSTMTTHHVADVPGLLKVLFAHLVPGGRLAIADLDAEDGTFHGEPEGVVHQGFDRDEFGAWLSAAGFEAIRFSTAHVVVRPNDDGSERRYPIFLAVATRSA